MDYRSERSSLPDMLNRYTLQHSFIPRIGELVLWYPEAEGELFFNPELHQFMLYSFKEGSFSHVPEWRAGTVAEVPEEPVDFQDLILDPQKESSINQAGFRIEMIPDPNDDINKSLSRRYQYVRLKQIRPLNQWQMLLNGLARDKLHPSIENTLTLMSTISLIEKYDMSASRDEIDAKAKIWCHGVFLGPELLLANDIVRFSASRFATHCTDIMCIDRILLRLLNISADEIDGRNDLLAPKSSIRLIGKAYTLSKDRSWDQKPLHSDKLKGTFPYVGTEKWGVWYAMHPDHQDYEISFDRVIGRLHEYEAARIWQGLAQIKGTIQPSLSFDIASVRAGRQYASKTDARIAEGRSWFWADSRAEALALESLNGVELDAYDESRLLNADAQTFRSWEATLRIIDSQYGISMADRSAAGMPQKARGRQAGVTVKDGKVVVSSRMTKMAMSDESDASGAADSSGDSDPEETDAPSQRMMGLDLTSKDISMYDGPSPEVPMPRTTGAANEEEEKEEGDDAQDPEEVLRQFQRKIPSSHQ
ncbi:MAG: hypothetical protein Q9227_000521 [Pyrenula ochraceoflavens]